MNTVTEIVLACCILHNYLMGVDLDERLIAEVDRELMHSEVHIDDTYNTSTEDDDATQGAIIRDSIASTMWRDYICQRP